MWSLIHVYCSTPVVWVYQIMIVMPFDKGVTYICTMALANEDGFPEGCGITQSDGSYQWDILFVLENIKCEDIFIHGKLDELHDTIVWADRGEGDGIYYLYWKLSSVSILSFVANWMNYNTKFEDWGL